VTISPDQVLWSAPEGERAGRPLLILLHGHGMDERMGVELRHRLPDALVIASLRGPRRVGSGYGWFRLDLSLTYDQIATVAHDVLNWLEQQPGFSSVGVLGFSQGSTVATHCMRLAPERFAYGVVLSGFVVPVALPRDEELAQRRVPVFAGRGTADTMVPQLLVTLTDAWLAEHTDLTSHRYPALGHNVSDAEIGDLAAFLARQILPPG
jgi:phospholipase/carboxylesterase